MDMYGLEMWFESYLNIIVVVLVSSNYDMNNNHTNANNLVNSSNTSLRYYCKLLIIELWIMTTIAISYR